MLRAWRKVFEHVDQPPVTPLTDHECDGETTPRLVLDGATLTTPLAAIGLSTRALNALLRVNVLEVRDLLALAPARLVGTRGVGNKTRRELADAFKVLQTAFPDRAEPRAGTASTDDDAEPLRDRVGSRRSRESAAAFTLHGAWILVPSDDLRAAPVLDGKPIPVLSPSEWARLPEAWLRQQEASSRTKPDTVENAASR